MKFRDVLLVVYALVVGVFFGICVMHGIDQRKEQANLLEIEKITEQRLCTVAAMDRFDLLGTDITDRISFRLKDGTYYTVDCSQVDMGGGTQWQIF